MEINGRVIEVGQIYMHFKKPDPAHLYRILALGLDTRDEQKVVTYEALYDHPLSQIWVRPLEEFLGHIERDGYSGERFILVKEK